VILLELCAVLRVESCPQNKREAANDPFFTGANSTGRNDREQLDLDRRKRLSRSCRQLVV